MKLTKRRAEYLRCGRDGGDYCGSNCGGAIRRMAEELYFARLIHSPYRPIKLTIAGLKLLSAYEAEQRRA